MRNLSFRTYVLAISVVLSFIFSLRLYHFAPDFVSMMDHYMEALFNFHMRIWVLQHVVFALSIGTLPFWVGLWWSLRRHSDVKALIRYIMVSVVLFQLILFVGLMYGIANGRKDYYGSTTLNFSSEYFWNYAFGFATIAVIIVLAIMTWRNQRSGRNQGLIDQ